MTFRKMIGSYLKDELKDEELNEFLLHLNSCKACQEELEINFIVDRGVQILDDEKGDYNILAAFRNMITGKKAYLTKKKDLLRFLYCLDACVFWAVLFSLILFLRMKFF